MIRIVLFLVLIALAAAGSAWMAEQSGDVVLSWGSIKATTTLPFFMLMLGITVVAAIFVWAMLRGRAERVSGYVIEASRAMAILERSSPEAAAWWHENAPQHVTPKRYLVFHESVCQVIDA